jgi:hypothetical protein
VTDSDAKLGVRPNDTALGHDDVRHQDHHRTTRIPAEHMLGLGRGLGVPPIPHLEPCYADSEGADHHLQCHCWQNRQLGDIQCCNRATQEEDGYCDACRTWCHKDQRGQG